MYVILRVVCVVWLKNKYIVIITNRRSDSVSLSLGRYCRENLNLLQLNCLNKNLSKLVESSSRTLRRLSPNERKSCCRKQFMLTVFTALYVSAFEEYCKHPSPILKQMPLTEGVYLKEMRNTFKLRQSHVSDRFFCSSLVGFQEGV